MNSVEITSRSMDKGSVKSTERCIPLLRNAQSREGCDLRTL